MTPTVVYVGTFVGATNGGGAQQSTFVTFSFTNTGGFDAFVPIIVTNPNTTSMSCGAEVTLYRSCDGGTTWETQGWPGAVFNRPTVAAQVQRQDVLVPTGQFLVSVMVGGGATSTFTATMGTAQLITAYA